MRHLIFTAERFEGEDWIVTARPDGVPSWRAVEIRSGVMRRRDAEAVARWLNAAQGDLGTLFGNLAAEEVQA